MSAVYLAAEQIKPDIIIQLGDSVDFYAHAKFARSHNICTPEEEQLEARQFMENFWKNLKNASPNSECIQLLGNHCVRPMKRIAEKYPELMSFVSLKEYFTFPGVTTNHDTRQEVEIDGVIYTHGHFTQPGAHMRYYLKPVVHGHTHRGSIIYENQYDHPLWELDCGYLADPTIVPLQYTATKRVKWMHGFGLVDKLGARFCPL